MIKSTKGWGARGIIVIDNSKNNMVRYPLDDNQRHIFKFKRSKKRNFKKMEMRNYERINMTEAGFKVKSEESSSSNETKGEIRDVIFNPVEKLVFDDFFDCSSSWDSFDFDIFNFWDTPNENFY